MKRFVSARLLAVAVAAGAAALALAGCGDGGAEDQSASVRMGDIAPSQKGGAATRGEAPAVRAARKRLQAVGNAGGDGVGDESVAQLPPGSSARGGGDVRREDDPITAAPPPRGSKGHPGGSNGKGNNGGPKGPGQVGPAGPADDVAGTPYARARKICSDPGVVGLLPEEDHQDPEKVARFVSGLVPAQDAEPTYDGCLDGLRSLGL